MTEINESVFREFFEKIYNENGGLPVDDDEQAARAIAALVLDMGYDPHWAEDILSAAQPLIRQLFDELLQP